MRLAKAEIANKTAFSARASDVVAAVFGIIALYCRPVSLASAAATSLHWFPHRCRVLRDRRRVVRKRKADTLRSHPIAPSIKSSETLL
jgi:hypothetical protein